MSAAGMRAFAAPALSMRQEQEEAIPPVPSRPSLIGTEAAQPALNLSDNIRRVTLVKHDATVSHWERW